MFFSISKVRRDNFSQSISAGDFFVNLDPGWEITETIGYIVYYKGYADDAPLLDLIPEILIDTEPRYTGNFCCIIFDKHKNCVSIKSDKFRGFPIFVHPDQITNLVQSNKIIYTNILLKINSDLSFEETKFNLLGKIETSELPLNEVEERISGLLCAKTKKFLSHNQRPIKVFLSGGVDSLLVFSFLNKFTKDYTFVKENHIDHDKFWSYNHDDIQKFWAYKQIHYWVDQTILTSGTPGDEFMLRGPEIVDLYLQHKGLDLATLLVSGDWDNTLMAEYYTKYIKNGRTTMSPNKNTALCYWDFCNMNLNDWQHWHIGETLTWAPLRDIEIFKLILRLPVHDALDQIFSAKISLNLMNNNYPNLSNLISDRKNKGSTLRKIYDFYEDLTKI